MPSIFFELTPPFPPPIYSPFQISKKEGYKYFDLGAYQPSPDHTILAYSIDTTGYETYDIHFKDIKTESPLKDVIKETAGGVCWGADNSVVSCFTNELMKRESGSNPCILLCLIRIVFPPPT